MKPSRDKRVVAVIHMEQKKRKPVPDAAYRIEEDELLRWVAEQPELLNYLISLLAGWKYIRFDRETHSWKGVACED